MSEPVSHPLPEPLQNMVSAAAGPPPENTGHDRKATFLGIMAILLWSSTVGLVRSLSEKSGPALAGAAVYTVSGILLTARCLIAGKPLAKGISKPYLSWCGGAFVFYTVCLMTALGLARGRSESVVVGLLNYLWPALTILFSIPLLGNRGKPVLIPGILMGVAGIFMVLAGGTDLSISSLASNLSDNSTPYLLGMAAAVSWALYSNLARLLGGSGAGQGTETCAEGAGEGGGEGSTEGGVPLFTLTSGLALLILGTARGESAAPSIILHPEALILGTATALGYLFWDIAMRRGDMAAVAACSYATPFLSTLFSCLYLGVSMGDGQWAGCLLIIGGAILSKFGIEEQKTAAG